jgi:hypothetical protein
VLPLGLWARRWTSPRTALSLGYGSGGGKAWGLLLLGSVSWICEQCDTKIFETTVSFNDPADAVKEAYSAMAADEALRKCSNCGHITVAVKSEGPARVWRG